MNYYAAAQNAQNWCWAASAQMVLSAHDILVSQEELVRQAYGHEVDWPATAERLAAVLNSTWHDRRGRSCRLTSVVDHGPPPVGFLISQLQKNEPVIVGYTPEGAAVGHAVIVTAVIIETVRNEQKLVRIIVRDPWPDYSDDRGKRIMTPGEYQTIHSFLAVSLAF